MRKGVQGTGILAGIIARVPSLLASNPSGEKGMREGEGWKRVKRRMRKRKTWGEEEGSKTRNELSVEYYYSSKYLKVKKLKYKIDYLGTPRLKIK